MKRGYLPLLLLTLALNYASWLHDSRHAAAALLVFAAPPAVLALGVLGGWQKGRFTASVLALGWFSHGVMRAWTDHPASLQAWATLLLALAIIGVASGPAARARLATRRARRNAPTRS